MTQADDPVRVAQAIRVHLYEQPADATGLKYKSSLIAILNDARGAANRDSNGKVISGRSQSWLAATGYLILLDQVGKSFARQDVADDPGSPGNPISHALRHFSTVTDVDVLQALYALRNALAHDYSLFNRPDKDDRPKLDHAFNLTADEQSWLVRLPDKKWDRVYRNVPSEQVTTVNVRKLGDLGEEVFANLQRCHHRSQLRLRLPLDEFVWRYGIMYYEDGTRQGPDGMTNGRPGRA